MNRRERRELKRKFRKLENTIKRVKSSSDGEIIYQDDTGKFKTSIYRNLMSQVGERYNDTSNHNDAKAAEYIGYNKEYYDRNNFNIGNPYTYFDDVVTSGVPKNFKDSFFGFEPLPNDTPLPVKLLFSIRFLSLESVAKYSNEEGQIRSYSFLLAKTTNLDYGTFLMFNDEGAFFQSQDSFFER